MKLAFIVQRYGREILGGAETLARQIAERLARRHDIEILTTTARDYITWRNEFPGGEEKLRGVRIRRFPVEKERNLEEFDRYSDWIYKNEHTHEDELRWLDMQGPVVPQLIDHLRREHGRYDLLVFFTYLYYPTYFGLKIAPEKSVLVPTAHDEPPLALEIYRDVFGLPSSFIFNAEAEELLVLERFGVYKKMRETIGIGMDLLDQPDAAAFRRRYKLSGRYLLYAGRIDAGKGCEELIRYFRFYKEERPAAGNLQLVLIGKQSMKLPNARDIRYLGFLDEDEKLAAMAGSLAVIVPSRLESLSIVALEALSVGSPVIAHAGSRVLVDHCRKSNAGLYYADYDEFEEVLDLMLTDKNLARGMGRLGQRYIKENFGWEKLLNQFELTFRASARAPRPTARSTDEVGGTSVESQPMTEAPHQDKPEVTEPGDVAESSPEVEQNRETVAAEEVESAAEAAELAAQTPKERSEPEIVPVAVEPDSDELAAVSGEIQQNEEIHSAEQDPPVEVASVTKDVSTEEDTVFDGLDKPDGPAEGGGVEEETSETQESAEESREIFDSASTTRLDEEKPGSDDGQETDENQQPKERD